MVHGGGHHHRTGGDDSRSAGINTSPNDYHRQHHDGHWHNDGFHIHSYQNSNANYLSRQYNGTNFQPRQDNDDECNECCKECALCCGCACCVATTVEGTRRGFCLCPWSMVASLVLGALLIISYVNGRWTLNAGETRQIRTSFLTEELEISGDTPGTISVYALGECPPLTGPRVSFGNTADLRMKYEEYQYDYFYLNAGSVLDVTIYQTEGASAIRLLQGNSVLKLLEEGFEQYDDGKILNRNTLVQRYTTAWGYKSVHFSYAARETDVYIVLYDNASYSTSDLTVDYEIDLTTYNLAGIGPTCSSSCKVHPLGCILVQANDSDDKIVTVHYSSSRRWLPILAASFFPLLLGMFLQCRGRDDDAASSSPPPSETPMENDPEEIVPIATAPMVPSQAPDGQLVGSDEDYAAIPITISSDDVIPLPVSA